MFAHPKYSQTSRMRLVQVVAPNLDHGMVGKFECRDGYMLKGNNTTQCYFGNWTGLTPWCKVFVLQLYRGEL